MQVSKKKMPYGYAVGYIVDGKTAGKGNLIFIERYVKYILFFYHDNLRQ